MHTLRLVTPLRGFPVTRTVVHTIPVHLPADAVLTVAPLHLTPFYIVFQLFVVLICCIYLEFPLR